MKQALLIIDMQKDFLVLHKLYPSKRARVLVPQIKQAIEIARGRHLPIIYILDSHKKTDSELKKLGSFIV